MSNQQLVAILSKKLGKDSKVVNFCLEETAKKRRVEYEHILYAMLIEEVGYTEICTDQMYSKILSKFSRRVVPLKKGANLYPHQIRCINFIHDTEQRDPKLHYGLRGGIVAMDMGLGKSLTISFASLVKSHTYPTLIIASKTLMGEWKRNTFDTFFPKVKVLYLHNDFGDNEIITTLTRRDVLKYDFVVTTYDVCVKTSREGEYWRRVKVENDSDIGDCKLSKADDPSLTGFHILYGTPWERVVCDESQCFANYSTKRFLAMMALYGKYKWCLTGTPIRNYETDIWSQLRFVGYNGNKRPKGWNPKNMVAHSLNDNILRLGYKDACITLPEKKVVCIDVKLSKNEWVVYNAFINNLRELFQKFVTGSGNFACILSLFTRLRQVCVSPYITLAISKRDSDVDIGMIKDEIKKKDKIISWLHDKDGGAGIKSQKISAAIELLGKIKDKKVVVFSMFVGALDLLNYACKKFLPHLKIKTITGKTKTSEREKILTSFKTGNTQVLLLNYKVGAEGLNLAEGTVAILLEPWWTDAVHNQAISRIWRIGQTKPVKIYIIKALGPKGETTIENRIVDLCEQKTCMSEAVFEGRQVDSGVGLTVEGLKRILA